MATMRPNELNLSITPILSANPLPVADSAKKPSAPRTPRIDVEPLYAAVKGAVSDADWTTYKKSLSDFLLGELNQEELSWRLGRILTTPALERAHNALVTAIYANCWRDVPEAGIASWVSSSDKPSSGTAKGAGDESEKRLKYEVMQLSRRERKRLKTIPPDNALNFGPDVVGIGTVQEYIDARRVKQPETGPTNIQGGSYSKTNWDLEIRKRYTSALFSETHEFPTATTISHRLLPICYEFGLAQGHTPDCPDYLNLATETYIKEALASFLGKVCANGPSYIRTGEFKKRVAREERLVERGELARAGNGELPVETEERRTRRVLCMEDLRLALELGDSFLGQTPLIAGAIVNTKFLDTVGVEDGFDLPPAAPRQGINGGLNGGLNGSASAMPLLHFPPAAADDFGDPMLLDDDMGMGFGFGWQGGSVQDLAALDDALDDVLSLGDL
ncbi:hypothetical protein P153DRAFT_328667 [Dothidotthia symphoricarpi CBS 119687]|uniref:Transcriptional co-activator n=1 Tax=Dothidotthia symphoricarpi CBS 119687 TaxID=1392245 RepID=A0A6A6AR43_9PLEO|nr:uncharacterized protein P153DRAFT_328667 [Dothidotthia symphoricarpi CBS 119687]KAF2134409.1 hypothetical protein P153DRAFT_328667 [Dothidotthia symphoricarpi CBS 119687]